MCSTKLFLSPLLIFYLICMCYSFDVFESQRPKTVRVHQLKGKCHGYEKVPVFWRDVHLTLVNRTFYIFAKVVVRNNIDSGLKLDLKMKRCKSRDALDSCEEYPGIQINHLCKLINNQHTPWHPFVELMQPSISCPLRKGVYVVNNGTFDGTAMNNWPLAEYYWKVTVKVLDNLTNDVLMCIYIEMQVAPI